MFELNVYAIVFYALAVVVVAATLWAVVNRNLVHTVILLVVAFIGTAGLFFLLGAPLLAALEVIIYAGAFMVLFLFIIMTMKPEMKDLSSARKILLWTPGAALAGAILLAALVLIVADPSFTSSLPTAWAKPGVFGHALFDKHWLAVEIASLLLFVGLVGGLYLGRGHNDIETKTEQEGASS